MEGICITCKQPATHRYETPRGSGLLCTFCGEFTMNRYREALEEGIEGAEEYKCFPISKEDDKPV